LSPGWTDNQLRGELQWGIDALTGAGLPRPTMFASPGWSSPVTLRDALRDFGFTVLADRHDEGLPASPIDNGGLVEVPTGMIAEPGGVGFIENLIARRLDRAQRLALYDQYFDQRRPWMVYDHPALAGGHGRPVLEELIDFARRRDYTIVPLSQMAQRA
jgi:peptidoglycan/xylan/chitin deacetylase (PgdA/CDA1 family)